MKSFVIKIGELFIQVNHNYDLILDMSKDYVINTYDHIDVDLNDLDIDKYLIENRPESAEVLAILESLANHVINFNMILVHGASIEYKDKAYLFMAPSGTGKTTHIKHWKEVLNDVGIINGDKPLIDEKGYIYGTPFSGKERWNKPVSYKLDSLIFIVRDSYNHIEKVDSSDVLQDLLNSVHLPKGNELKALSLVNAIFSNISMYKMYCVDDISAAKVCIDEVVFSKKSNY